jgi:hypothetical protein
MKRYAFHIDIPDWRAAQFEELIPDIEEQMVDGICTVLDAPADINAFSADFQGEVRDTTAEQS